MKRPRLNPRKLLVASAGVATINYALAAGCSGKKGSEVFVANLVASPPGFSVDDDTLGTGGSSPGAFPGTVANLVAPPPPVSPSPVRFEPLDAGAKDAGDADTDAG
jgi:hypothetical protein